MATVAPSEATLLVIPHSARARNPGKHPFLLLHVVGRYCTHPQHPRNAVDMAYSIRHVPGYDAGAFETEGNAFLDSPALGPLTSSAGSMQDDTLTCEF